MKMRYRITALALACSVAVVLPASLFAGGRAEEGTEVYRITAGIGLNDQSAQYESLVFFQNLVETRSDGRIQMEIFHSSQLGDDREMMEALQRGEQEMTCPSTAPIAPFVPEFGVFDLPFLFPSYGAADYVLDSEVGQQLLDSLSDIGIKGLVFWENGYRHLTNSARAVSSPEDVSGMRVRTMENTMHLDAWRAMGANPTPMAFGELFSAMQQRVVDGQENPWGTIYLQNFPEVQGYATDTGHVYSPFVLMIGQQFWDRLPSDLQEITMQAAIEARDFNRELNRRYNAEYLEQLKSVMTVVELTPEQRQEFQNAVQPIYQQYADTVGRELLDSVVTMIEEYMARN